MGELMFIAALKGKIIFGSQPMSRIRQKNYYSF